MDRNKKKEMFSIAYIKALAASIGANYYIYAVDDDSVDLGLEIKGIIGNGAVRSPKIDIQLKCTASRLIDKGDHFTFPLKIKNYEDLCHSNNSAPRLLIVLKIPEKEVDWIQILPDEITLRNSAYWLSLIGMPSSQNSDSIIVKFPKGQRLTLESLLQFFKQVGSGEQL